MQVSSSFGNNDKKISHPKQHNMNNIIVSYSPKTTATSITAPSATTADNNNNNNMNNYNIHSRIIKGDTNINNSINIEFNNHSFTKTQAIIAQVVDNECQVGPNIMTSDKGSSSNNNNYNSDNNAHVHSGDYDNSDIIINNNNTTINIPLQQVQQIAINKNPTSSLIHHLPINTTTTTTSTSATNISMASNIIYNTNLNTCNNSSNTNDTICNYNTTMHSMPRFNPFTTHVNTDVIINNHINNNCNSSSGSKSSSGGDTYNDSVGDYYYNNNSNFGRNYSGDDVDSNQINDDCLFLKSSNGRSDKSELSSPLYHQSQHLQQNQYNRYSNSITNINNITSNSTIINPRPTRPNAYNITHEIQHFEDFSYNESDDNQCDNQVDANNVRLQQQHHQQQQHHHHLLQYSNIIDFDNNINNIDDDGNNNCFSGTNSFSPASYYLLNNNSKFSSKYFHERDQLQKS